MDLDGFPDRLSNIPAEVLNDLDAVLERMRRLSEVLGTKDQIEFCQVLRVYFDVRTRAIEAGARAWRDDPFGLDVPRGPVLVPMPTRGDDGGAE